MGLSYGGWITGQYALYSPERLNKAVILSPAATVQSLTLEFYVRMFVSALPVDFTTKSFMYWVLEDSTKDENKRIIIDNWIEEMLVGLKCFKFRIPPFPTVLKDDELKSIKIPVLYLDGENNKIYSSQKAIKRINSVAPQIKTEILPNAGHDLTVAQSNMVNEKVVAFLSMK